MFLLEVAAVVGAGTVGGVYAAFDLMVIPALRRGDDAAATRMMTAINRVDEQGPFIELFALTALAALTLGEVTLMQGYQLGLLIAGASLASTAITISVNVPLNRRLDRDGAAFWPVYCRRWSTANSIRALAAIAAVGIAGTQS